MFKKVISAVAVLAMMVSMSAVAVSANYTDTENDLLMRAADNHVDAPSRERDPEGMPEWLKDILDNPC